MIGEAYPRCKGNAPDTVKKIVDGLFYNERRALIDIPSYLFFCNRATFLKIHKVDGERLWDDLKKRDLITEGRITGCVKLTSTGRNVARFLTIP